MLATALVGLLLQYTLRDRIPGLAAIFYGLPPLVVVVASLLSVGLLSNRSSLRWILVSAVVAALAIITWLRTDYARAAPTASAGNLRIVLWNVAGGRDLESVARILKATGGQVIVLLESGPCDQRSRRFWESRLPGHTVTFLSGCATVLSEHPISGVSAYQTGKRTHINTFDLRVPAGRVSMVIADIESNLFSRRGPLIARAYDVATSSPSPTVVLGDFNTPHTSTFFREFRRSFQHAFERAGAGLIPTWPTLCPVLTLDHIWLSADVTPVYTRTLRTFHSDHAAVIADVRLNPAAHRKPTADSARN